MMSPDDDYAAPQLNWSVARIATSSFAGDDDKISVDNISILRLAVLECQSWWSLRCWQEYHQQKLLLVNSNFGQLCYYQWVDLCEQTNLKVKKTGWINNQREIKAAFLVDEQDTGWLRCQLCWPSVLFCKKQSSWDLVEIEDWKLKIISMQLLSVILAAQWSDRLWSELWMEQVSCVGCFTAAAKTSSHFNNCPTIQSWSVTGKIVVDADLVK